MFIVDFEMHYIQFIYILCMMSLMHLGPSRAFDKYSRRHTKLALNPHSHDAFTTSSFTLNYNQ